MQASNNSNYFSEGCTAFRQEGEYNQVLLLSSNELKRTSSKFRALWNFVWVSGVILLEVLNTCMQYLQQGIK